MSLTVDFLLLNVLLVNLSDNLNWTYVENSHPIASVVPGNVIEIMHVFVEETGGPVEPFMLRFLGAIKSHLTYALTKPHDEFLFYATANDAWYLLKDDMFYHVSDDIYKLGFLSVRQIESDAFQLVLPHLNSLKEWNRRSSAKMRQLCSQVQASMHQFEKRLMKHWFETASIMYLEQVGRALLKKKIDRSNLFCGECMSLFVDLEQDISNRKIQRMFHLLAETLESLI
jgi:hypothetical protein